jgi:hypothetical protein
MGNSLIVMALTSHLIPMTHSFWNQGFIPFYTVNQNVLKGTLLQFFIFTNYQLPIVLMFYYFFPS